MRIPIPARPAARAAGPSATARRITVARVISASSAQVVDAGFRAELFFEPVRLGPSDQPRHEAFRVVRVPEVRGVADAARDAGGELPCLQPVQAEVALARVPLRRAAVGAAEARVVLGGRLELVELELRRVLGVVRALVGGARGVRASREAVPAADALVVVDGGDAVLAPPRRADRADRSARRLLALHARPRKEALRVVRVGPDLLLDDRAVDDARGKLVLRLARDRARVAARALAQVD